MTKVGQVPVSLNREMPGFVLNRMQYALLNECFRLVLDDVGKFEEVASIISFLCDLRFHEIFKNTTILDFLKKIVKSYGVN